MDEFVEAKIEVIRQVDARTYGPIAVLKTARGYEYHVWFGPDGYPLIERAAR